MTMVQWQVSKVSKNSARRVRIRLKWLNVINCFGFVSSDHLMMRLQRYVLTRDGSYYDESNNKANITILLVGMTNSISFVTE